MSRKTPRINPWKLFHGAFVPNWLLRRSECTQGGKLMYARLAQYAGEDGYCFPSQYQLSQELGVTDRQVRTYIAELIRLKLIEKERCGLRKTDRYYFRMHPWIKAAMTPPARADELPQIPDRKYTSTLDRKYTSTLDRKHTSTLDRKHTSKKFAAAPSATRPSGRVRDSVVRDSAKENQPPPPPTPSASDSQSPAMAPKSEDVVEVGEAVAVAQGEETTATDGGIESDAPTPFDQFFVAYPHHRAIHKARKAWEALDLDAMLPTILEALSWQKLLTGDDALLKYPHAYLENKRWLDARPVVLSAWRQVNGDGTVIYPAERDEGHECKAPGCHEPVPGTLSDVRCDDHALRHLEDEAHDALHVLWQYSSDALFDELEGAVWPVVNQYHINGDATDVRKCIVIAYEHLGGDLQAAFLAKEIARVVAAYRAKPKPRLACVN